MNVAFIIITGLIIASVPSFGSATETGTMMCNGGIVSIGDTAGEVIGKCGSPATATKREEKILEKDSRNNRPQKISTVAIDDWTFNFGPNQFQYQVILANGRVSRIESLNYGY